MPRTTLAIEDRLLRRLKEKAAREGRTLQETANNLLRQGLDMRPQRLDYQLSWKAGMRRNFQGWTCSTGIGCWTSWGKADPCAPSTPNVLVFAEIRTSPFHETARQLLGEAAEGSTPWGLPWPCVYEFLRVVTHPRIYYPPVPVPRALQDLGRILASSDRFASIGNRASYWNFQQVIKTSGVAGNLIHDAHIAALCLEHGVSEFVTGDRDFQRFPNLRVSNPFM